MRITLEAILDKYIEKSLSFQSKIGYDTLIQNVILTEIINLTSIIIVDINRELKLKISKTNIKKVELYVDKLELKFNKNSIGQHSNLLFQANPSEPSWLSSSSI